MDDHCELQGKENYTVLTRAISDVRKSPIDYLRRAENCLFNWGVADERVRHNGLYLQALSDLKRGINGLEAEACN